MDARVLAEPVADGACGVTAGVVENDVELFAAEATGDRLEKVHELAAARTGSALADRSTARHLERACGLVTPARR